MSSSRHDESALAELGEADPEIAPAAPGKAVRPFVLGAEAHPTAMPLAGLERIGERVARALRAVIEPYVRQRPGVVAEPLETMRFDAWRQKQPAFVALSHYRSPVLKNGFLLALDPEFVTRLVDAFYGGSGGINAFAPRATEFTAGEERIAGRLADQVIEVLAGGWAELLPLDPALAGRETSAVQAGLVRGDELVVLQRFQVDAGPAGATRFDIVYPMAALKPHAALAGGRPRAEASPADTDFRRRLAMALEQVQLPVRSVLARPSLSLDALMTLKPGDVIPISVGPRVPLLVANRRVAEGTIGEQEGRAALMIELIERSARDA